MDDATPQGGATATPDAPPAASPAAPANGNVAARDNWYNAAANASQPGAQPGSKPETETPGLGGAQIPQEPVQPAPMPVTSLKRGGLLGVVDDIANVLAGKQRPELGKDPDGNLYVKQHDMTRGEQWMKIAGEAMHGAAAGLAAGKGAGNMGKAPLAGMEAQQQDADRQKQNADDMQGQVDKQKLANANNQMLQMKMAENAWNMAQQKVKATQEDVKFNNDLEDRLVKDGGKVIGTAAHPGDIADILKVQPDVFEQMIKKQTVRILPNIDADGTHQGIKAIIMPTGYHNEVLPAGAVGHAFNPVSGRIEEFKYSDPVTAGERDVHDAAAVTGKQAFDAQARKAEKDAADLANVNSEKNARDKELPGKMAETASSTNKNNAEAAKDRAEPGTGLPGSAGGGGAGVGMDQYPPAVQQAVKGLLSYQTDPNTFPQRKNAKTGQMDRETAIGLAQQMDPSYDEKQYKSRSATLKDFTSGPSSNNILSLNTAIQHLNRMAQSGAAMGNTGIQGVNAVKNTVGPWLGATAPGVYKNDVNAVANEMASLFKKTAGTDQEITSWKDTMSTAQTPAQIKHGIDEMLNLMEGRYDALDHKYSSAMGRPKDFQMLSAESRKILQGLGNTGMLQKDAAAAPATATPAGAVGTALHKGDGRQHYVDAKGNDLGVAP